VEAVFVRVLSKIHRVRVLGRPVLPAFFLCPDFEMQTRATIVYRAFSNPRAIGRPEHCHFLPDLFETGNVACLPASGRAETSKDSRLRI
jgi:hypothetical protein